VQRNIGEYGKYVLVSESPYRTSFFAMKPEAMIVFVSKKTICTTVRTNTFYGEEWLIT